MPRRRRHAEIHLLRRVRTFLSETTPRFVTFCECLSERSRVARGAGMVLSAATACKVLYIRRQEAAQRWR